jgi:hypothetical protein
MLKLAIIALLVAAIVNRANAEYLPIGAYLTQTQPVIKAANGHYLLGAYNALETMNIELEYRKRPPLFCPPEKLDIAIGQIRSIIAQHLQKYKVETNYPVEMVLLDALEEVFPCP